jgi:hypothetical protein
LWGALIPALFGEKKRNTLFVLYFFAQRCKNALQGAQGKASVVSDSYFIRTLFFCFHFFIFFCKDLLPFNFEI